MTPSEYLKDARANLYLALDGKWDVALAMLKKGEIRDFSMFIPPCVPTKYYDRMQHAWRMFVVRAIFQRAKQRVDYKERYRLAQKIKQGVKGRDGR